MSGEPEFLLPSSLLDRAAVPADLRAEVAYKVLAAKYCALVEAVMKLTGGQGVTVSLRRAQEIAGMDVDVPPEKQVVVLEEGHQTPGVKHGTVRVRLATTAEKAHAARMERLHRMGGTRN